ncbi:hypothetical protein [Chloroflexus sp.]|uniref:hypothetical protein n=1 Tax=Chloroflexus sp. TaxID=1904827 RepID=UPI00298F21A9|nr:hypothetical protein [Chloroflexus sp.]MDW8403260.1 hypothetical protein [Chloroflexus sp.]
MGSSIDPLVWNWLDELLMLFNGGLAGLVSGGLSALFLRQCWRLSRAWISVWWLAWVLGGMAVWLLMWWQVGSDILPDEFLLSALWLMTGLCIAASFTLIVPPWRNR